MIRKFLFIPLMLALLAALAWSLPAAADGIDVSGTITADNQFILYYGPQAPANASDLKLITQSDNSFFPDVSWKHPVSFGPVNIPVQDYLYLVAWNIPGKNNSNPQAWLGQITVGNVTYYSNLGTWQYIYSKPGNPSVLDSLAIAIATGGWQYATSVESSAYQDGGVQTGNTSPDGGTNIWKRWGPGNSLDFLKCQLDLV
jgi:hypothetical protein